MRFLSVKVNWKVLGTGLTYLGLSQDICMPAMRAQASAIYVGVITIVASLGPVIVSQQPPPS